MARPRGGRKAIVEAQPASEREQRLRKALEEEAAQLAEEASAGAEALERPMRTFPIGTEDAARLDHLGLDYWTILRDVGPVAAGGFWSGPVVSHAEADAAIGSILDAGWKLRSVRPIAYTASGIRVLWQFERGRSGFTEARHIARTLSPAATMGAVTGFQADALITGLVRDGWKLLAAEPMAPTGDGVPMFWLFVR